MPFVLFFLFTLTNVSGVYTVTELDGGPIKRQLFSSFYANDKSTLRSKIFLLNQPATGLQLSNVQLTYSYKDRQNVVKATVIGTVRKDIVALEYRVTLYNVYGEHINNLSSGSIEDLAIGAYRDDATWASYDDEILENLTAVVYVHKVRFKDGSVWRANYDELTIEFEKLRLIDFKEKAEK